MPTFTIKSVMPTGKTHDQFGTEYYVQFNEDERAFPLWYKKQPEIGQTQDGNVVDGKFKKEKKEWNPNGPAPSTNDGAPAVAKPAWRDNSTGMRIGMCINNAAAYVNTLSFPKALTDREWAETVIAYASALFPLSELDKEPGEHAAQNVSEVFGDTGA